MYQTRTCNPSGCDTESRCVYDSSCTEAPTVTCTSITCSNNIVSFKWETNPKGKNIDDFELDIKENNDSWQVLLTGATNQNCYSDCHCPVNSSCYNDFKNNYSPSQGQLAYIYWTEGDEIIFWFKYGGKENTSYKFKGKIKTEHGWSDWAECETTWCGGPPVPQTCSDGTPYGQCSQTKPKYCDNGRLIDKCSICGCPPSYVCQKDGNCAQVGEEVKIDVDASQSLGKIPNIYKWGAWWEDAGYEGSLFIQHRMKEKFINECDNIGIVHDSVIAGAIGASENLEGALNFINNSELEMWEWGREIREKGGKFGIYIYGCCTTPKWLSSCEEDKCEKEIEIQGGDKQEIYSCAPPRFKDDSNDKYYGLEWKEIVQAIVKKAKEEIGPGVYYFIGHEPEPSWYDTEESFFEFYKYTRRYIKEIDPEAKVGGFGGIGMHSGKSSPALVENGWQDPRFWGADNDNDGKPDPVFKNFLRYLGENNIDIDFINWHSFAIPPDISAQKKDKEEIQDWLEEVGLDKNTEIILSDWHFWPNDCSAEYEEKSGYYRFPCPKIDTEIPGSYYISAVMAMDEGGFSNDLQGFDFDVRGWMADSVFPDPIVFKGDWSIYTKYGIIKPEFYALQLLANIGKERVKTEISTSWWKYNFIDVSAISAKDDGILKILISNYIPRGEHAFLLLLRVLAKELGCKEASDIKECVLNNFPQEVSECVKNNQLKECLLNCLQNPKCYEQITPQGKEAIEKAFEMDRLIKRLQKSPRDVYITVKGLSQGTYTLKTYLIDKDHANSCRYNKKTEPTPTDLPCGIDGNIDIRVKQAKEDAGNIAKQQARGFLINKGYSDRDINYIFSGIEHCKGNITCFKNLVERYYQQSDRCINHPQTCSFDIIWNELTEACNFYQNVFHNLFYYGKYETITIPDYIDKINNDPNVSLEGSEKEKTITIGEDRTYKETIEMQPYSVYLLLFIPSSQTCSDGTPYGECSSEKPKHCNNGKLIDKCDICGCPEGYTCQANGSCISLPVPTQCIGDINNDKRVDIYDLIILITHWGQENTADLNNDKTVNLEDLIILLTHWGEICEDQCQIQGDVDNNGEINCDDLDCVLGVILEENSLEECPCSDVNKDGEINQLDVNKETDILLSKGIECGRCKQCSDCGKGLFNVCDRQECLSCQENCYFIDKTTGGDCLSCSSANSCQDYQDDKITCQTDPCGFGNCKWENDKCISIQLQTCSDGTLYGECSQTKPKYCDNGRLIDKCSVCGCPEGSTCQADGSCVDKSSPITRNVKIKHFGVGYAVKGYASLCKQMGVGLIRVPLVAWGAIEPDPPEGGSHDYKWQDLDEIIREYQNNGFRAQLIVKCANSWACKSFATDSERFRLSSPPKNQYWDDYYYFIYNLVERYDGDGKDDMPGLKMPVLEYEIESEAHNTEFFWDGTVEEYGHLLETAYKAAKKANPNAKIILSGINFGDYGKKIQQFFEDHENVSFEDIVKLIKKYPPNIQKKMKFIVESLKYGDYYDAVEFHFNRGYEEIPSEIKLIKIILDAYSIHNKSILAGDVCSCPWVSEIPPEGERRFRIEQATLSSKKLTISAAHDIESFVLESIRDFPQIYQGFGFAGIFDNEKNPRPVFYAYKQTIKKIKNATKVECWEEEGVYVYRFYFSNKPPIYVVWSETGRKKVKLSVSSEKVRIEELALSKNVDYKIVEANNDGTIIVEIDDKPLFIVEIEGLFEAEK